MRLHQNDSKGMKSILGRHQRMKSIKKSSKQIKDSKLAVEISGLHKKDEDATRKNKVIYDTAVN